MSQVADQTETGFGAAWVPGLAWRTELAKERCAARVVGAGVLQILEYMRVSASGWESAGAGSSTRNAKWRQSLG